MPHADTPVVVLFRNDLRVSDNLALSAAAATGRPLVTLFILEDAGEGARPPGAARRWWLHHSLEALSRRMAALGGRLLLRRGTTAGVVDAVLAATGADAVYWNRRYDPPAIAVDAAMKTGLRGRGIRAESFDGCLLHEPARLSTGAGTPYRVFTPFWRALADGPEPRDPADPPRHLRAFSGPVGGEDLGSWNLLPRQPDWAGGLRESWTPGEDGASSRLADFLDERIDGYRLGRDRPGVEATSRLSPHLAHGEITPFQVVAALRSRRDIAGSGDAETFRKELAWREFSHHLLFHYPALASRNHDGRFDDFPWRDDHAALRRWQQGRTGFPIVDAGMRQLWRTGWMHNRVRMVAASFLVKHLLVDWRAGERWFWDTLVDADPANNPASWQWVAGSGADTAPYFRVFNPILQGEKFDPEGDYVRSHVPELADLPAKFIHQPWKAPEAVLSAAGVKLGTTYPVTLIEHHEARSRALAAYERLRGHG